MISHISKAIRGHFLGDGALSLQLLRGSVPNEIKVNTYTVTESEKAISETVASNESDLNSEHTKLQLYDIGGNPYNV